MTRLKQHLPNHSIKPMGPNVKLYTWALWEDILSVWDDNWLDQFPIPQVTDRQEPSQQITIVRHLESKYNEYKNIVVQSELYKLFSQEEDPVKKKIFALELLDDFRNGVGVDYTTDISVAGHEQWEKLSLRYASLIDKYPDIFPSLIIISPYLRTRTTAHYFLKNVSWFNFDFDKLIGDDSIHDMILWSFHGKDVVVQLSDEVRERDHWSNVAPSYLRKYINSFAEFDSLSWLPGDDTDQLYYYTSDGGWESQTQVNQRAKTHFNSLTAEDQHKKIMVFSHHLYILWWLNTVFKWTYKTFFNFDHHRKPLNGSVNIFSKLPQTQLWQQEKLRVAWYNLMLEE